MMIMFDYSYIENTCSSKNYVCVCVRALTSELVRVGARERERERETERESHSGVCFTLREKKMERIQN